MHLFSNRTFHGKSCASPFSWCGQLSCTNTVSMINSKR